MINVYKSPISKEKYANLFLDKISEDAKNVCLLFIGHSETVHYIMSQKPEVDFTVIDGSDVTEALPYIYTADNLKERITFEESDCEDETFLKKLETCFENYIMNNMSFDLIIANPPYGKSSSLSKKIVNKMLECKVAEEYVVLAPWKTFEENLERIKNWKNTINVFEDVDIKGLAIATLNQKSVNVYKSFTDLLLTKKLNQLYKAIQDFNSKSTCKYAIEAFDRKLTDTDFEMYSKRNVFLFTIRCANNRVHILDSAKDCQFNLLHKALKDVAPGFHDMLITFETKQELQNFTDWWYKEPGTGEAAQKTLIYNLFEIIVCMTGSSAGTKWYKEILPNLDWSKPHDDAEILKEIGLPEDFLEKE